MHILHPVLLGTPTMIAHYHTPQLRSCYDVLRGSLLGLAKLMSAVRKILRSRDVWFFFVEQDFVGN